MLHLKSSSPSHMQDPRWVDKSSSTLFFFRWWRVDTYVIPQVDVWALGVLLYALTSGCMPFYGSRKNVIQKVKCGSFPIFTTFSRYWTKLLHLDCDLLSYLTRSLVDLLEKMIEPDPRKRIKMRHIAKHPWMVSQMEKSSAANRTRSRFVKSLFLLVWWTNVINT